jgi:hypothetical protein
VGGSDGSSACSSSYYSVCSEDGLVAAGGSSGYAAGSGSCQPHLMWLPVQPAKRNRASLKQHLQQALEFVSGHIAAGRTVLLHDVEGTHCPASSRTCMRVCHVTAALQCDTFLTVQSPVLNTPGLGAIAMHLRLQHE